MPRLLLAVAVVLAPLIFGHVAHAATMSLVSDLISTSAPGIRASHTIEFKLASAVPASGKIVVSPDGGAFTIPGSFDYSDVALAIATSGPYVDRSLAAAPSGSEDGVAVVSGSAGSLTFTLSSSDGIAAGSSVRIVLASSTDPMVNLINSAATGSYRIRLSTADAGGAAIDAGTAMIAIVAQVGVNVGVVQQAPVRSNGLPSGTVAANNTRIELSLDTDEISTCRLATSTGVAYDAMTEQFLPSLAQSFYLDLSGFQNSTTYTYYVRCKSSQGIENTDDYQISFTLGPTPISNTSVASAANNGTGGVGPYIDGSSVLYLGSVSLAGSTIPGSTVTILKDGAAGTSAAANADGTFSASLGDLERGVYSFELYAADPSGRQTAPYTATLTVGQGSANAISGIVLPPTISLAAPSIAVGATTTASGESIPNSVIELSVSSQSSGDIHSYSATSSASGAWEIAVPGEDLSLGTYLVQARAVLADHSSSDLSTPLALGVGVTPGACSPGKGDFNGDGKVNLVDFSIMLTSWGKAGVADLNCDGTINLADFSILLYNWTG